jgi:two-component system response regulator ChvI
MAEGAAGEGRRLLLVDDDPVFRRVLAENLRAAGYAPVGVGEARQALALLRGDAGFAACLVDWDMPVKEGPGMDGLGLARALAEAGVAVPVLFLTAHGAPIFEEAGLAAGAVDFIDKARGPAILLQRLALALSRGKVAEGGEDVVLGALVLREGSARALWRGREVALSRGEFEMVRLLARQAGRDVAYRALYDALRGEGFAAGAGEEGYRANVRAMVKRIRRKFEAVDPGFDALGTYAGFGYRWREG